ncbi:unnamed protein product [Phytophthora fragariaefolia]|uniref:Unnamed protein product n=1 Tax=Phytophthora fragariaefolia TaxID=1490495 RepID=A0A9W6Y1U5_9STRA|nr:unnamed protein product [Phytophthora fragariaefolia]
MENLVKSPPSSSPATANHIASLANPADKNSNPMPKGPSDTSASGNPPRHRRYTHIYRKYRKQREADGDIDAVNLTVVTPGRELSVGFTGGVPLVGAKGGVSSTPDTELEELQALIANATWTLIKSEPSTTKLHSKWVYKKKRYSNGSVQRYKARLVVACGSEEILGVNYTRLLQYWK